LLHNKISVEKNIKTAPETGIRFLDDEALMKFRSLKEHCDTEKLLSSGLYQRVFCKIVK